MSFDTYILEKIKAEAINLGFSLFGISSSSSLEKRDNFRHWLEYGFQGNMSYLSRPDSLVKRFSPSLLVDDCKTIISLGFFYPLIHFPELPSSDLTGWISSFALMDDYHTLLKNLARSLAGKIKNMIGGGFTYHVFTDSAPILEREFGVLGNIGWIGKNTNLISPLFGSNFLLAEILTNAEFDANSMITPDHCGKCNRCIEACPTQCIQPNRTVDARKCISYLTIENKGVIPVDLRMKIGHWVFGCDLCQMVCPWNLKKGRLPIAPFKMKINPTINPEEQLYFSENEFLLFYSGTSVLRVGWLGFIRNLIIVLGNLRNLDSTSKLIEILNSQPSAVLRSHAAWALGRLNSKTSHNALFKALKTETDPFVADEIRSALFK